MPLRVRCPECKTVLDVPTGSRPTCPKCGFAGRSAQGKPNAATPAPQSGVKFSRTSAAPAAPAAPAAVAAPAASIEWQAEGEWTPVEGETADAWAPAEAGQGQAPPPGWPEAEDEWAAADTAPVAQPEKKRRWGRKAK